MTDPLELATRRVATGETESADTPPPFAHSDAEVLAGLRHATLAWGDARIIARWPARHSELIEVRDGQRTALVKRIVRSRSASAAGQTVEREYDALRTLQVALEGSEARIPEPLALLSGLHALVLTKLPGRPLADVLKRRGNRVLSVVSRGELQRVAGATGTWLRHFHRATGSSQRPFRREEFENELRGVLDRLSREPGDHIAYDVVARRIREACARLEGTAEGVAARHGDFIPQNVLLHESTVGVVDFENFRSLDTIYYDVGSFRAYLALMMSNVAYSPRALRLVEAAFMTAYGDVDRALAALYTLRAALRNVAEIDVHSRRGRRRRQRFSQQLITLSASVLQAASGIRA